MNSGSSRKIIGGSPASAGYRWNTSLGGWWRDWDGSLIRPADKPAWDAFIPKNSTGYVPPPKGQTTIPQGKGFLPHVKQERTIPTLKAGRAITQNDWQDLLVDMTTPFKRILK